MEATEGWRHSSAPMSPGGVAGEGGGSNDTPSTAGRAGVQGIGGWRGGSGQSLLPVHPAVAAPFYFFLGGGALRDCVLSALPSPLPSTPQHSSPAAGRHTAAPRTPAVDNLCKPSVDQGGKGAAARGGRGRRLLLLPFIFCPSFGFPHLLLLVWPWAGQLVPSAARWKPLQGTTSPAPLPLTVCRAPDIH